MGNYYQLVNYTKKERVDPDTIGHLGVGSPKSTSPVASSSRCGR